jgi:hypothetical protein
MRLLRKILTLQADFNLVEILKSIITTQHTNFDKIDMLIHFDRNFPALHESLISLCQRALNSDPSLKKLNNYSKN